MTGVSLVGFSGSLVKDAVKETVLPSLVSTAFTTFAGVPLGFDGTNGTAPVPPPEPIESPEVTKVLIGTSFNYTARQIP